MYYILPSGRATHTWFKLRWLWAQQRAVEAGTQSPSRASDEMAVRLLLPVVLAAVLFHPDAAVQGKKAAAWREGIAPYHRCGACDTIRREIAKRQRALSPANKVLCSAELRSGSGLIGAGSLAQSWWLHRYWECVQVLAIIGDIIGTAENVCRPRKEEADWMLRIHVAPTKDYGWEVSLFFFSLYFIFSGEMFIRENICIKRKTYGGWKKNRSRPSVEKIGGTHTKVPESTKN